MRRRRSFLDRLDAPHYDVVLLDELTGVGFDSVDGFRTEKQAVKAARRYCTGRGVSYSGNDGLHRVQCSAIVRKHVGDEYTVVFSCSPPGHKIWKDEV